MDTLLASKLAKLRNVVDKIHSPLDRMTFVLAFKFNPHSMSRVKQEMKRSSTSSST